MKIPVLVLCIQIFKTTDGPGGVRSLSGSLAVFSSGHHRSGTTRAAFKKRVPVASVMAAFEACNRIV